MAVLGVFLMAGSLNLERVIDWQTRWGWFVLFQPLALLLFLVSTYAEASRLPFDLPEAEQELVGGYHTEYSSMKLAMMLMAEYFHLVTTSFIVAAVFLGGWHLPGVYLIENPVAAAVVKLVILVGKMLLLVGLALLVRWTIPRFRFDQLMNLTWKVMLPLALLNLVCVMVVMQAGLPLVALTVASVLLFFGAGFLSLRVRGSVTHPR